MAPVRCARATAAFPLLRAIVSGVAAYRAIRVQRQLKVDELRAPQPATVRIVQSRPDARRIHHPTTSYQLS